VRGTGVTLRCTEVRFVRQISPIDVASPLLAWLQVIPRRAEPQRVLVVEDYADAREMYSEYLRLSGFEVVEATNGLEAVERAIATLPDVILMDFSLPVIDGWEATRRLKADPRTSHIPVVALTGHDLADGAEGARRAGCERFVTKPCLPDDLVQEVEGVLAERAAASAKKPV
jgi:two-component system cell cycle response regulator DivK